MTTLPNDPAYVNGTQWTMANIGLTNGWNYQKGSPAGILLGIVDSGIMLDSKNALCHDDLKNTDRLILGTNFVDRKSPPKDTYGSGTKLAGIIGAETNNGIGMAAINWYSSVYICKAGDQTATTSAIQDSIEEIVNVALAAGQKAVICLGYSSATYSKTIEDACRYVADNGMILCVGVGDSGSSTAIQYPAALSTLFPSAVIAVGSTNSSGTVSSFSCTGSQITVVAPGESIYTTTITSTTSYANVNGTALAAATTSGLISMLWSANNALSNGEIRALLISGAKPLSDGTEFSNSWGYGLIQAYGVYHFVSTGSDWGDDREAKDLAFGTFADRHVLAVCRNAGSNERLDVYEGNLTGISILCQAGTSLGSSIGATCVAVGKFGGIDVIGMGTNQTNEGKERFWLYKWANNAITTMASGGTDWGDGRYPTDVAFGTFAGYECLGVTRCASKNERFYIYRWDGTKLVSVATGGTTWSGSNYATSIAFGKFAGYDCVAVGIKADSGARVQIFRWNKNALTLLAEAGTTWGAGNYATSVAFGTFAGADTLVVGRKATGNSRYFLYQWVNNAIEGIASGGDTWASDRYVTSVATGTLSGTDVVGVSINKGSGARFELFTWDDINNTLATYPYEGGTSWSSSYGANAIAIGTLSDRQMTAQGRTEGSGVKVTIDVEQYPGLTSSQKKNLDAIYPIPNNIGLINDDGVNLFTGNIALQTDLFSLNGRNVTYALSLMYNSASAACDAPTGNCLKGHGWKLMDYPKIVLDAGIYYFLDGKVCIPLQLKSGSTYSANGDYYLWTFSYSSSTLAWTIVSPEATQYTLGNSTTLGSYTLWNLSTIKDLVWQDTLTFTYSGTKLLSITNTLNQAMTLTYDASNVLTTVTYTQNTIASQRIILQFGSSSGISQLSTLQKEYLLPGTSTYAKETLGTTFSYFLSSEAVPYALKSILSAQGGTTTYDYYVGDKLVYKGQIVTDQHPVISVTMYNGQAQTTTYGLYYNFLNWVFDESYSLTQFNEANIYPGGVVDHIYYSPEDPFGHTSYYFFNGQTYNNLLSLSTSQDPTEVSNPVLLGKPYTIGNYEKIQHALTSSLAINISLGTTPYTITLSTPAYNVLSLTLTASSSVEISFYLYDNYGSYLEEIKVTPTFDGSTYSANYEFSATLTIGKIVANAWNAATVLKDLKLSYVVVTDNVQAYQGKPIVTSDNLSQNVTITSASQTIPCYYPYTFVTAISYSVQAGTSGTSDVVITFKNRQTTTVATLTLTLTNYETKTGTLTFSTPIEIAGYTAISTHNNAVIRDITFTYLSIYGLQATDDLLSKQITNQQTLYGVGYFGTPNVAYPQVLTQISVKDYVEQIQSFTYNSTINLPTSSTLVSINPKLDPAQSSETTTLKTDLVYAFQVYTSLESINLKSPIAQTSTSVWRNNQWVITEAKTIQWKEFSTGKWASYRTYLLIQSISSSQLSTGFDASPSPTYWKLINDVKTRNTKGFITSSANINTVITSQLFDSVYQTYPVASFNNANVTAGETNYYGFETYESAQNWAITGGQVVTTMAYVGKQCYGGSSVYITSAGGFFLPQTSSSATITYYVSAYVYLYDTHSSCQLGFIDGDCPLYLYDGQPRWQYVQAFFTNPTTSNMPFINLSNAYVDALYFGPVNSAFAATVWNNQTQALMATLSTHGQTVTCDTDVFNNRAAIMTEQNACKNAQITYNSRLGNFIFTGNDTFNSAYPNAALSVQTLQSGVWESFLFSQSALFKNVTLMTMGNHQLKCGSSVSSKSQASAQYASTISSQNFCVLTECIPQNIKSGEKIGIRLSGSASSVSFVLTSTAFQCIDDVKGQIIISVSFVNIPQTCKLTVAVLNGTTLYAYANGRYIGTCTASDILNTASLISTNANAYFYAFGINENPVLNTYMSDGLSQPTQCITVENAQSVLIHESLYNNTVSVCNAVTKPTKLTSGASLTYQNNFAIFDDQTMTVSGTITQKWPSSYCTQPYCASEIPYNDPALRVQKGGTGGQYTAGKYSTQMAYSRNDLNYLNYAPQQLNALVATDSTKLTATQLTSPLGNLYSAALVNTTSQVGLITGMEYDDQLRLTNTYFPKALINKTLNRSGYFITNVYDFLSNITKASTCDSGSTLMTYNSNGNLATYQDANATAANTALSLTYDVLNRVIEIGRTSTTSPTTYTWLKKFTYDLPTSLSSINTQGNLMQIDTPTSQSQFAYNIYNVLTRLLEKNLSKSSTQDFNYTYNQKGWVTDIQLTWDETYAVHTTYDLVGRVTGIGTVANPTLYASYTYENGVKQESLNQGKIIRTITENAAGWIESISDGNQFFTEKLYYDTRKNGTAGYTNGQVASLEDQFHWSGAPSTFSYEYTYDSYGRLQTAICSNAAYSVGDANHPLTYDENGNILSMYRNSASLTYGYTAQTNQIKTLNSNTCTYDPNGNLKTESRLGITQMTYNEVNNLVATIVKNSKTAQFTYNGSNQLTVMTDTTNTVEYARGTSLNPLMEKITTNGVTSILHYIYGPTGLIAIRYNNATYFVLKDYQGSIRVIVDANNNVLAYFNYTPFGALMEGNYGTKATFPIRYRYTGQEYLETLSIYNYHARLYDPYIGRFLAPDSQHQFASPYCYGTNPITFKDPTGNYGGMDDLIAIGSGAVLGAGFELGRQLLSGEDINLKDIGFAAVSGGIAGEITLYTGGLVTYYYEGLLAEIAGGAVSGGLSSAATQVAENAWEGKSYTKGVVQSAATGAVSGGISSGFSYWYRTIPQARHRESKPYKPKYIDTMGKGDHGELMGINTLRRQGYYNFENLKPGKGDKGVDIIASNRLTGRTEVFEIKTNTSPLSDDQAKGGKWFAHDRAKKALNWKKPSLSKKTHNILLSNNFDQGYVIQYKTVSAFGIPISVSRVQVPWDTTAYKKLKTD